MRVGWNLGFPLAGVTARNRRAATRSLRLAAAAAERVSRLRARLKGFAVIVAPPTADSPLARRRPLETFASCRMEGKVSASSKLCNMHPSVTSGRGVRRSAEGECKALCPRPQTRNPLRRRSGKPQAPRRGAPVARRDPCKRKAQAPRYPHGCREGRRPFAGFPKGQRPFGGLSGQRPDRGPEAAPLGLACYLN